MSKPSYVIRQTTSGQDYFVLRAPNNEVVLTSESYTARHNTLNGIESVRVNAPRDDRYQRLLSSRGQAYFVLRAANNEILGTSEMYSSVGKRDQGIESVKTNAPIAEVRHA